VTNPLFALTKKDTAYEWTESCQKSYEGLKRLLTTSPILAFPNFTKGFLLAADASGTSGVGLGAVLSQAQEYYQFAFLVEHYRSMNAIMESLALGIVWAVKHFRSCLYSHSCDIQV